MCILSQHYTSNFLVQCCLRHVWATLTKQCCTSIVDTTLYRLFYQHCTGNFLMQCCPRYVQSKLQIIFLCDVVCGLCGQHCRGNFLVQCWLRQIKATLCSLFSCKNMSVCPWSTLQKLSQTYLENIDQTIFLCNVVPAWSIQHCVGYFLHKSCLLPMDRH